MKKLLATTLLLTATTLIAGCFGSSSSNVSSSSSVSLSSSVSVSSSESSSSSSVSSVSTSVEIPEIDTQYTDALNLTVSYTGMEFIEDGIGEVTFTRCTDGDTANFNSNGIIFPVRFLGIDTPESTSKIEPWGMSAARFTCDTLSDAEKIVLQAEGERVDSTGGRYLAWVWYQPSVGAELRLINLEIIEQAYSPSKGLGESVYAQTFYDADLKTQPTLRRIWGEDDPEYDYSNTPVSMTIADLRLNYDDYVAKWVVISQALVTRKLGSAFYIQDDSGSGLYLYPGYSLPDTSFIRVGDLITIQGKATQYANEVQLVELQILNTTTFELLFVLHSRGNPVLPTPITINQMEAYRGAFVEVTNITVNSFGSVSDTGAYSVYGSDSANQEINIRIDGSVDHLIPSSTFSVGQIYTVRGIVSRFYDDNQLMVTQVSDIVLVG